MEKQIVFRLKTRMFALPISKVERIINLNVVSQVPDVERYIMGVTEYNSEVLPVMNMAHRFFQEELEEEDECQVLVSLWNGHKIGLAVDEVTSVRVFEENEIETEASSIEEAEEKIQSVTAFVQTEEGIISLINVDKLFNEKASEDIRRLLEIKSVVQRDVE